MFSNMNRVFRKYNFTTVSVFEVLTIVFIIFDNALMPLLNGIMITVFTETFIRACGILLKY
jgi:hypothetical protein